MRSFTYEPVQGRVVFGVGTLAQLAGEVAQLGVRRAIVLSTPGQRRLAEQAFDLLGPLAAGIYAGAVMHVPVETAEAACAAVTRMGGDVCVAIGGGSTIGLAKAIAREYGLPIVAIPTTYAGSEMTAIWGLTEAGIKRTGKDEQVRPRTVIYDPTLTLALPPTVAGPSGLNAMAHCVEALYAPDANPILKLMAEEGIRTLAESLPEVVRVPDDLDARTTALFGAWLASAALGGATLGLHHKLCHTLGGSFNLPHANVHAVILPHAAAYNAAAAPDALARVARAMAASDAPQAIFDLALALQVPTTLRAIGMREEDLDRAADLAVQSPYPNPAAVTREGVRRLLDDAFYGRRPTAIR